MTDPSSHPPAEQGRSSQEGSDYQTGDSSHPSGGEADPEGPTKLYEVLFGGRALGKALDARHSSWSDQLRQVIEEFADGSVTGFHRYVQDTLGVEESPSIHALRSYLRPEPRTPASTTLLFIALATKTNPYWLCFGVGPRTLPMSRHLFPEAPSAVLGEPVDLIRYLREQGEPSAAAHQLRQVVEEYAGGSVPEFQRYLQGVLGVEEVPTVTTLRAYLQGGNRKPSARTFLFIAIATRANPFWLAFGVGPRQLPSGERLFPAVPIGEDDAQQATRAQPDLVALPVREIRRGRLADTGEPDFVATRQHLPQEPRLLEALAHRRLLMLRLPHDYMREEEHRARLSHLWLVGALGGTQNDTSGGPTPGMSIRRLARSLRLAGGDFLVRLAAPSKELAVLGLVRIEPSSSFELLTCELKELYLSPDPREMMESESEVLSGAPAAREFYNKLQRRPVGLAASSDELTLRFGAPQKVRVAMEDVARTQVLAQGLGTLTR